VLPILPLCCWWVAIAPPIALASVLAATQPPPQPAAPAGGAATAADEEEAAADEDPRTIVAFNLRLQHIELGDGNNFDLVLLRRDAVVRRPGRPNIRLATLRWDLPVGQAHIGGEEAAGLGDLYFQAVNFRDLAPGFSLGSGLAFQFPTATDDFLGAGKWQVAPSFFPVVTMKAKGAIFFARIQDFISVAGDDDRRDIHQLAVAPTFIKLISRRQAVLFDTEAIADWERDGEVSWKSGLLFATRLSGRRAAWIKVEVPWGEHRRGEWTVRASIAWRRRIQ
jgi:hypothetical protein